MISTVVAFMVFIAFRAFIVFFVVLAFMEFMVFITFLALKIRKENLVENGIEPIELLSQSTSSSFY